MTTKEDEIKRLLETSGVGVRLTTAGFPQWYKEQLAQKQFEGGQDKHE